MYEVTSPSVLLTRGVEMVSTSKKSHLSTKSEWIVGPNSQLLRVDNNKFFFLAVKTRHGGEMYEDDTQISIVERNGE